MDTKILYIGLATFFLVLISTLALVIIVLKPDLMPIPINIQTDSLSVKKGGVNDSLNLQLLRYTFDSINYSISMLAIKRENLSYIDSTKKLSEAIDYDKKLKDSMRSEIKKAKDSITFYSKKYLDLVKANLAARIKPAYSDQQKKGYAKIYEGMTPESAAKQIGEMTDIEAVNILLNIDSKQGAKILDKVEPKKAAKIWNALNTKRMK